MIADLHVHSSYSFDSRLTPKKIVRACIRKGLDVIAVVDHNTVRGGLAARMAAHGTGLTVIPGIEVKTDMGDLIGLFDEEEVKARGFAEALDEIRDMGGLTVLPHPYRGHPEVERLAEKVDALEVFNARTPRRLNLKALKLAVLLGKPVTVGSDAHTVFEIGSFRMYLKDRYSLPRPAELKAYGRESPFIVHLFSGLTGLVRRLESRVKG